MSEQSKSRFPALPRNVWVVTITSFLTDISSEMLVYLIPLFLFNTLGVKTSIIGLIEGVAETTASLVKIISGWLSDRLGQRKWLAVAGYGLSTVAKPFLYFANSWGWVLGVRFSDRIGKGLRTAPRDALVADSIDEKQRGLAFGIHRAGDTAGAAVGLLVALVVVWAAQKNVAVLERSTFQLIVLFSVVPAVLAVIGLTLGAREVARKSADAPPAPRFSLDGFDPSFKVFLLIVVLFTLGNSSDAFLVLRAQNAGLPVLGVLGMMLTFNVVYTVVSGPAGALSDRIGRRRLIVGGWLVYGFIYLGFALANAGWQTWGLMAVYGVYYGMTEGVAKAFVADLVRPEQRGTAYGLFNAAVGLTAFPASFIAGVLWQGAFRWQGFGPSAPFWFGSALALLATGLLVFALPQRMGQR
ncbi:MAG: MFS transporter [Chloroflexi bacterium]|nr:MFS transporter [Chloroflexota bacterium]